MNVWSGGVGIIYSSLEFLDYVQNWKELPIFQSSCRVPMLYILIGFCLFYSHSSGIE